VPDQPDQPGPPDQPVRPRIVITYCTQCKWLLRAQWYAGELLTTFADEVGEVALAPTTGGVFRVDVAGESVWNRKRDGGFPEITDLKRRVRDIIAPEKSLGHSDRVGPEASGES